MRAATPWLVALSLLGVGCASATVTRQPRAESSTPTPTPSPTTIVLDPPANTETFAPPGDAVPGLTADEAIAVYEAANPNFQLPEGATSQLGYYTAAVGDGTYRHKDQLAWGLTWHECIHSGELSESPSESILSCTFWMFLDANTGEGLEGEWQLGE